MTPVSTLPGTEFGDRPCPLLEPRRTGFGSPAALLWRGFLFAKNKPDPSQKNLRLNLANRRGTFGTARARFGGASFCGNCNAIHFAGDVPGVKLLVAGSRS